MVLAGDGSLALLAVRTVVVGAADAYVFLALVGAALAVLRAGGAHRQADGAADVAGPDGPVAFLSGRAVAVMVADAFVELALFRTAFGVVLAHRAHRSRFVLLVGRLAEVGAGDRRSADLSAGAVAVVAADAFVVLAMIGTAFVVSPAGGSDLQRCAAAEVLGADGLVAA